MHTRVKGIILAGVHRWEASILEQLVPRVLIPIANRPLVVHTLDWLRAAGTTAASVCANSDTSVLRARLGHQYRHQIAIDFYEDAFPRGPAGCVRDVSQCGSCDTFVVVDATILPYPVDLHLLLAAHDTGKAALTVAVRCTGAEDSHSSARAFAPMGIYVVSRSALRYVSESGYQDIKETLIPQLHANGERVVVFPIEETCPRVTGADSYLAASAWMLESLERRGCHPSGHELRNGACIHTDASVDPLARLVGPVLVGPGAIIERGVTIVGPTTIGADCRLAQDAVVSRSALWDHACVEARAVVDRCILTYGTTADAGRHHYCRVFADSPPFTCATRSKSDRRSSESYGEVA